MFALLILIATSGGLQASPPLVERAKVVAATDGWAGFQYQVGLYMWLNDGHVLWFEEREDHVWDLRSLDVATGQSTTLGVSALFEESGSGLGDVSPSPDGRLLLWCGQHNDKPHWFVATLDGKLVGRYPRRKVGGFPSSVWNPELWTYASWLPDSKEILETAMDYDDDGNTVITGWIRSVDDLASEQTILRKSGKFDGHPAVLGDGHLLGTFGRFYAPVSSSFTFVRWAMRKPSELQEWDVTAPAGHHVLASAISPDSKRVAWMLGKIEEIEKGEYGIEIPKYSEISVWTSTLMGTHWTLIGSFKNSPEAYASSSSPQWQPSGQGLSFILNKRLYVVPLSRG